MKAVTQAIWSVVALISTQPTQAQTATVFDLYLAQLQQQNVVKVTQLNQFAGYHNQPQWSQDGNYLYWSVRRDDIQQQQTDIRRLDVNTLTQSWVSIASQAEFSPHPIPGQSAISTVVVEDDNTQRLYEINSLGQRKALYPEITGVGYHAWHPDGGLALFVLGKDDTQHELQYRSPAGRLEKLSAGIGRALTFRPKHRELWFTLKQADALILSKIQLPNGSPENQLRLPLGGQDLQWLNENVLLASAGSVIWRWQSGKSGWSKFLELSPYCRGTISRFGISPDLQNLAFVCERPLENKAEK